MVHIFSSDYRILVQTVPPLHFRNATPLLSVIPYEKFSIFSQVKNRIFVPIRMLKEVAKHVPGPKTKLRIHPFHRTIKLRGARGSLRTPIWQDRSGNGPALPQVLPSVPLGAYAEP